MTRYCICRSKNGTGFMIQCDRCMEWFHGKCIDLTKKKAKYIEKYYCKGCRESIPNLEIVYQAGHEPEQVNDTKQATIKQEPQVDEKKPQKKVLEKIQSIPRATPAIQLKNQHNQNKRRVNQKSKSKSSSKKQCANPECRFEARSDSKYCSDECGIEFNKALYVTHFIPRWRELEETHSESKLLKRSEITKLETEKEELLRTIKSLKEDKEELDRNIKIIKELASKRAKENIKGKNENDDDDEDSCDNGEEALTGDANKSFCITCGLTVPSHLTLKHWATCHKKHEDNFNFTADVVGHHTQCKEDENPKLYCHYQDKKTKRYCMQLESACPHHSNWQADKDEVCGCPHNIMQKLDTEKCGGLCLELRKDCTQHYHWDKFRLAQLNMQRIQAFVKLDLIVDKIRIASTNYDDTYGGVVGIMLHKTIDHKPSSELEVDVDVEMTTA